MAAINLKNLHKDLLDATKRKDVSGIRKLISQFNPADVASTIQSMDLKTIMVIIRSANTDSAAEVFPLLEHETQEDIINKFTDREIKDIIAELFSDDVVDLLDDLPASLKNKIIKNSSGNQRSAINKILNYDYDMVGSLITTEYVFVYTDSTVKQALKKIKSLIKEDKNIETYSYVYVTDRYRTLKGVIKFSELIFASPNKKITSILDIKENISILDTQDKEKAIEIMQKYDNSSIAVVNKANKLVGIITFDDIIDLQEEEATEDIHKMAAVNPTHIEYSKSSISSLFKSRVLWLLVLMITATLSQVVIENGITDTDIALLAGLIPLMMDTAGNAGGQSGAMIIRALSTNDITTKDYLKVASKELVVALLIGFIIFIANWLRMLLLGKDNWTAMMTSSAVFITIIVAKFLGASLPIFAKKINLDPAVVAAPLITTIVDLLAIVILFGVYKSFPVI